MFSLNLHVVWSEGYAGDMLRGVDADLLTSSSGLARIWAMKVSASAKSYLRASLVDLDGLKSS